MLIQMHVKNLALIEEIDVEFGRGLNILTGETGAGKSILLGSLQLVLGGKISRNMIRENADYALVELLFQVENPKAAETLRALDIVPEDGQVLLSRKIMEGRSVNRINGETCTVSQMKAAAACLLDIHGQHEHQSLLYQEKQLEILDAYGREEIRPAKERTSEAYRSYQSCRRALSALDMDEDQRKRETAFLEFEVQEIEKAHLIPGEDEELEKLYRRLSNGKQIAETLQAVHSLTGYESGEGAGEVLGAALRELARVTQYDDRLETLEGSLREIDGLVNDFNREISSYMDELTFDDETFFETEKRLDLVNGIKARYGQTIEAVLEYQGRQQEKLDQLMRYEENLKKAEDDLAASEKKLKQVSHELSKIREKYASKLEKEVVEALRDLNFLDVRFQIRFDGKKTYTAGGCDDITFEISTNPGESLKPLGQIVSGGELSRIMLALKTILADKDEIETLIFDEIDAGISGRTAQKVSEKMAVIGAHHQVLCITHLPQIAAMADTHFGIEKHADGGETVTEIHPLKGDASVAELARLLGGAQITDAVLQNAREMKELACVHKNTRLK